MQTKSKSIAEDFKNHKRASDSSGRLAQQQQQQKKGKNFSFFFPVVRVDRDLTPRLNDAFQQGMRIGGQCAGLVDRNRQQKHCSFLE
jgi:hypothetical protein